jgi:hypothetical protein
VTPRKRWIKYELKIFCFREVVNGKHYELDDLTSGLTETNLPINSTLAPSSS